MGDIMGIQCDAMQHDASAMQCSAVQSVQLQLHFLLQFFCRSGQVR